MMDPASLPPQKESSPARFMTSLVVLAVVIAIAGGAYWVLAGSHADQPGGTPVDAATLSAQPAATETGDVKIGAAPYTLMDMNGKTITEKTFTDKYKLVFFGFTHCTDACPIGLQTIGRTLNNLGADAQRVQALFISVDPRRDTPKVIQDYVKNFSPAILGASGTAEQIKTVTASFRAYASDSSAEVENGDEDAHHHQDDGGGDEGVVNHSDNIYLLAPGNRLINAFNGDVDANTMTRAIQAALLQ